MIFLTKPVYSCINNLNYLINQWPNYQLSGKHSNQNQYKTATETIKYVQIKTNTNL